MDLLIFTLLLSPFIVGMLVHDREVQEEQRLIRFLDALIYRLDSLI